MMFGLLLIYQVKHFIADYPLQGKYMLGKFLPYPKYILPLLAHCLVHGVFTFVIVYFIKGYLVALLLSLFDMVAHFIIDRIKASPNMLGRFKPLTKETYIKAMSDNNTDAIKSNTYFWWALGLDQMLHHLTHYIIIWVVLYV